MAAAFNKDGEIIYTAHNYGNDPVDVTFSDGYVSLFPPNGNEQRPLTVGTLSASFRRKLIGGSVELSVLVNVAATAVEFLMMRKFTGAAPQDPYVLTPQTSPLASIILCENI